MHKYIVFAVRVCIAVAVNIFTLYAYPLCTLRRYTSIQFN